MENCSVLVFFPERVSLDRVLKRVERTILVGAAVCVLGMGILFLCYPRKRESGIVEMGRITHRPFAYETIGSGALALRKTPLFGWVARLSEEVTWIAYNSRPDGEGQLLCKLQQGGEPLRVQSGQMLYFKEGEKGLLLAEEGAPFWLRPTLLEGGSVLVEVGRGTEERGQFISSVPGLARSQIPSFVLSLKSAQFFPQDLFLQRYAGREYALLNQKGMLDVGQYGLFVAPGDLLGFENEQWRVVPQAQTGIPLACVRSLSDKEVTLEVWDETGFSLFSLKIETKKRQHPPFGPESLPAAIRLRTGTQISCSLAKRRLILKQGDWVLKTHSGWRPLRSTEEITGVLTRKLRGDLLVFEGIEKDPQGKCMMRGMLFDETHTYVQPLSLPITSEKPHVSRKRKGAR